MKIQMARRWAEVVGVGFLAGVAICLVLMTLSFAVGPEGGFDSPRPWKLPSGYEWTMIWYFSFPMGGVMGAVFAPVGYWLLRSFLPFRRMVWIGLAGTLIPGSVGAFFGPAVSGLAAIGGFLVVFFAVRVRFEG